MKTSKNLFGAKQTRTKLNESHSNWNDAEIEIEVTIRGNDGEEMGFTVSTLSELKAFVDAAEQVNPWEDDGGAEALMGFDDLSALLQRKSRIKMYSK